MKIPGLIGSKLIEVRVDRDYSLSLITDKGEFGFYADADCCSESWIEHFESPSEPEIILSFEEIDISGVDFQYPEGRKENPGEQECLQQYFYKITTEKASYLIEMRNSSNGYYGGWLRFSALKSL